MVRWFELTVLCLGLHALGCDRDEQPQASTTVAPSRWSARSQNGAFHADVESQSTPIPIGSLHRWTLTLTDAAGQAVANAVIRVDGGMPAHGHGLPTAPRVSPDGTEGRYVIEGVKFNMAGDWILAFDIRTPAASDRVEFPLHLEY